MKIRIVGSAHRLKTRQGFLVLAKMLVVKPKTESSMQMVRVGPQHCLKRLPGVGKILFGAVLLLRDVVGWSAAEVASLLDVSASSVTSALYRARSTLAARYPATDRAARGVEPGGPTERRLLERYVEAWEAADIDQLTLLLRQDATFPMPPAPVWYHGRDAIRAFISATILAGEARGRWKLLPTRANGLPAFGFYRRHEDGLTYTAFAIQVVTLESGLVADATTFGFPQLFPSFGLPESIPG